METNKFMFILNFQNTSCVSLKNKHKIGPHSGTSGKKKKLYRVPLT